MAAMPGAGPCRSQEPGTSHMYLMLVQEPKTLGSPSAASWEHLQTAEMEVEQPRHKTKPYELSMLQTVA